MWIFAFFLPEERSRMFIYLLVFPRGDRTKPVILEDWERAHLTENQSYRVLLSDQNIREQLALFLGLFFPQYHLMKILR